MTDVHLLTSQTLVGRKSDGEELSARGTRDGAMVLPSWYQALLMEGRVFGVNMGSASTPFDADTGASTPAFDDNQPTFGLDIPDNVVVIPLSIIVQIETHTGSAPGFLETFFGYAPSATALGAGTSTALTIVPMRIQSGISTSLCTARGPYTANAAISPTTLTGWGEFFRSGYPTESDAADGVGGVIDKNEASYHHEWSALDNVPPIIVGPAIIAGYVSSTSDDGIITAFATLTFAEIPESAVR